MMVYQRIPDDTVYITLRVPRRLWDRFEYRHKHFGKAIHFLRECVIDIMASHVVGHPVDQWQDRGDPFFHE